VHEDVQAFERSKHERRVKQEMSMRAHRDGLIKQIDAHKEAKLAPTFGIHELAINKRIIQGADSNGGSQHGSP
jgi:hypothetical protein